MRAELKQCGSYMSPCMRVEALHLVVDSQSPLFFDFNLHLVVQSDAESPPARDTG